MTQEINISLLPGILKEMAELIGLSATMTIVRQYGGVRLYIPKEITEDHPIIKLVGICNAVALTDTYGGETLEIAKAEAAIREIRNTEIRNQWPALSQRQLALKYQTTERNIRIILSGCDRQDDTQLDLFAKE